MYINSISSNVNSSPVFREMEYSLPKLQSVYKERNILEVSLLFFPPFRMRINYFSILVILFAFFRFQEILEVGHVLKPFIDIIVHRSNIQPETFRTLSC